jgi:hypothetical protein
VDLFEIIKLITDRASRGLGLSENRERRRLVETTMNEVGRAWQQGKAVQRRQQMVLMPAIWAAILDADPGLVEIGHVADMESLFDPSCPSRDAVLDLAAHGFMGTLATKSREEIRRSSAVAVQLPLATFWVYLMSRRYGAPSVFDLREGLAERLVATSHVGVLPRDVRLPFPGVYVQMPPGSLQLWNQKTGWHSASLVGLSESDVIEGPRRGRCLVSVFWCEPNEVSTGPGDDNAQVVFTSLHDDWEGSVDALEAKVIADAGPDGIEVYTGPMVKWQGVEYRGAAGHSLLRSFLVNFCLYLSSPNPDVLPTSRGRSWSETMDALEEAAERSERTKTQVRPRISTGKNFSLWDVGRNATRLRATGTDIAVHGFWRRQPCGPRWSRRKLIWIEPYIRQATGAEPAGHDYQVGPAVAQDRGS